MQVKYSELSFQDLQRFINERKITVLPMALIYIRAFWPVLNQIDRVNFLSAIIKLDDAVDHVVGALLVTPDTVFKIFVEVNILPEDMGITDAEISVFLASKDSWREAFSIARLDPKFGYGDNFELWKKIQIRSRDEIGLVNII